MLPTALLPAAAMLAVVSAAPAPVEGVTRAAEDLQLGFAVPGLVETVHVEAGERVTAGQLLATLRDDAGQATINLYTMRAESNLTIDAREAEWKLAVVEEERVRSAFEEDAASVFEVERVALQTTLARVRLDLARQAQAEARAQLAQAVAEHEAFLLRAPMDGVVDEIVIAPGETVEPRERVVRLVVIDTLEVDAYVPTSRTLSMARGTPAWVRLRLSDRDRGVIEGRLSYIAAVADARSDTRLVRITIPNPEGLPAGSHVSVMFDRPAGGSASGGRGGEHAIGDGLADGE